MIELVLKNMVTGKVSRIFKTGTERDREMLSHMAARLNERQGRDHKNVKWSVRTR